MIRRRRSCLCYFMAIFVSVAVFYVYYFILLKVPAEDNQQVILPMKRLEDMHFTKVRPTKAAGNLTQKGTTVEALEVNADGSEEVLDAEGNPIPDPELRKEFKRITAKVPNTFLPEFKNPCWLDAKDELNCLPYFYLIGMSKCGTTDLWKKLTSHPDIVDVPKEPHWWGPRRTGWTGIAAHGQEGDGSISTAYSIGNAWLKTNAGATDPPYTNAELLHAIQPKAKIIIIVRNPTERARSWYFYTHPLTTPDDWHVSAMTSIECYNSCMKQHNERYCAYSFGCPYTPFQGINVGLYHIFLYDWINAYTREGVLVLRLEDWHADQVSVYRTILEFLELRPLTPEEEAKALSTRWVQASNKVAQSKTKKALDDFYRPHNQKLAELLQSDIYLYP
eukprot:XP_011666866.1 PREDICTED: carbohydrate sulfotransferase 15 isoform X2 [Strongylocentrotus purpuratus]